MKSKGFVFVETIIVVVILTLGLTMTYTSFNNVISNEKKRETYNNVDYIYRTYYIEDFMQSLNIDEYINYYIEQEGKSIQEFTCNNAMLYKIDQNISNENINSELNEEEQTKERFCEELINKYRVKHAYITKYNINDIKRCTTTSGKISLECDMKKQENQKKYDALNTMSNEMILYLRTLNGKEEGYRLIVEYEEEKVEKEESISQCKEPYELKDGVCQRTITKRYYNNVRMAEKENNEEISFANQKYSVVFDANEGTLIGSSTLEVNYESDYSNFPSASKVGYTFAGWYTSSSGGIKIESGNGNRITKNMTLYAHYATNEYKITFDGNGGTVSQSEKTVNYGSTYGTLPESTKENYGFVGWYTKVVGGEEITQNSKVEITEDQILYARYSAETYTVSFMLNTGLSADFYSKEVTYNSEYGNLPNAYKSGYTLSGWYSDVNSGTKIESTTIVTQNKDHNLYARYNANKYYVSFNANGGQGSMSNQEYTYDTAQNLKANAFTRSGYSFTGWSTTTNGNVVYSNQASVKNLTSENNGVVPLYAKWEENKCFIIFDDNNTGTIKLQTINDCVNGVSQNDVVLESNTFTKTGHTFTKWTTNANGNGTSYNNSQNIGKYNFGTSKVLFLYANWQVNNYYLDLNGMLDGNSISNITNYGKVDVYIDGTKVASQVSDYYTQHPYGTTYEIKNITALTGHTYQKVYSGSISGTIGAGNVGVVLQFVTNTYTITLNKQSGSGGTSSITAKYGDNLSSITVPTRSNYTFQGYYTAANGGGTKYYDASGTPLRSCDFASNPTLYAYWKAVPTITFGSASISGNTVTLPYTYSGNGTLSVNSNNTNYATVSLDTTNKKITITAKSIGQARVTLSATETSAYTSTSNYKTITIGSAASSNSSAFQSALTSWGKIGPSTNANWYGTSSTSDTNILDANGKYTIIETVNTNDYTGFYYKDGSTVPQYKNIIIDFDMAVKDTEAFVDDDVAGIMVKFNPGSGTNVFSGYLLLLDAGGFASSVNNGLWRGNNNVFSMSGCVAWSASGHQCTKLVTDSSIRWTTGKWQHYKVEALGNVIRVYRWDTNSSASYTVSDTYKIFEYTDTSSSALTYGTYGFWTLSQSGVQFRNFVSVTSYNDNYAITVS